MYHYSDPQNMMHIHLFSKILFRHEPLNSSVWSRDTHLNRQRIREKRPAIITMMAPLPTECEVGTTLSTAHGCRILRHGDRPVGIHSVYKICLRYTGHRSFSTGNPPPIRTSCAHTAVATQFLWRASSCGRLSSAHFLDQKITHPEHVVL